MKSTHIVFKQRSPEEESIKTEYILHLASDVFDWEKEIVLWHTIKDMSK